MTMMMEMIAVTVTINDINNGGSDGCTLLSSRLYTERDGRRFLTELTFIPNSCSIFSLTAIALSAFSCRVARRASSTYHRQQGRKETESETQDS